LLRKVGVIETPTFPYQSNNSIPLIEEMAREIPAGEAGYSGYERAHRDVMSTSGR